MIKNPEPVQFEIRTVPSGSAHNGQLSWTLELGRALAQYRLRSVNAPFKLSSFTLSSVSRLPLQNGLNGVRTSAALDSESPTRSTFESRVHSESHTTPVLLAASSSSSTPKPDSPSLSISANGPAAPSSHLPSSLPAHSSSTLSGLTQDLPSVSQLNSLNRCTLTHTRQNKAKRPS